MSDSSLSFQSLCQLLEKIASTSNTNEKKRLIQNYIRKWVASYGNDVFDVVRLMVPQADDRKYNLKEDRLATLLIKSLLIDPQSTDGLRLKQYRHKDINPKNSGNFPQTAYEEMKKRSPISSSDQTVKQINEYLDKLTDGDQLVVFKEILNKYTAYQVRWIIRIILKDLGIKSGDRTILNAVHEGAYDRWSADKSLQAICQLDSYEETQKTSQITLFNMFKPQLCMSYKEDLFEQMAKPVYVEKKLDGERVLMHFDRNKDKFMWHSRRRLNEDRFYGTSSTDMTKLAGHIHKGILAKQVLLDGEMLAFDPPTQKFLPFGTLKDAIIKRNINDPDLPHPCYVVFDIINLNGTNLAGYPLESRLKILKTYVLEQHMYLQFIERKPRNTKEEVYSDLEQALLNREEGIVLKDNNSTYVLDQRSPYWLKYKPSYTDSLVDSCDLLLVGTKFGSGRRGGKLASILCAVRDDRISDIEPPRFVTFTLAGSGLSGEVLRQFDHKMKTVTDHISQKLPVWLDHPKKGGEPFDKLVDYQDGIVVEIKGAEIVESQKFGLELTLRFPAFVKFREDKSWQDIMTFNDVMKAKSEGGVGKKRKGDDRVTRAPVKKANTKSLSILPSQQGFDSTGLEIKTDIFQGKCFHVITGTEQKTKQFFEALIKENGGNYNQSDNAEILIAGKWIPHVRYIIDILKDRDILYPSYITDCIKAKRLLPIGPKYMCYTSPQTEKEFLNYMDVHHDTYDKKLGPKDLMEIMDMMKDPEDVPDNKQALALVERYFPEGMNGMLFLNSVAYFDFDHSMLLDEEPLPVTSIWATWKRRQEEMELAKARYEFEAGTVASTMQDARITHVVMHKHDLSRLNHLTKTFMRDRLPRFVTLEWVMKCFDEETLFHEADYDPKYYGEGQSDSNRM